MTDLPWPSPGSECICINDKGWWEYANGFDYLLGVLSQFPGPEFMEQYTVKSVVPGPNRDSDHHSGLIFDEFPDHVFCVCKFRPLEKIEDEEQQDTTAPVTPEKVS